MLLEKQILITANTEVSRKLSLLALFLSWKAMQTPRCTYISLHAYAHYIIIIILHYYNGNIFFVWFFLLLLFTSGVVEKELSLFYNWETGIMIPYTLDQRQFNGDAQAVILSEEPTSRRGILSFDPCSKEG